MSTARHEFERWQARRERSKQLQVARSTLVMLVFLAVAAIALSSCPASADPGQANSRGDRCYGKACLVSSLTTNGSGAWCSNVPYSVYGAFRFANISSGRFDLLNGQTCSTANSTLMRWNAAANYVSVGSVSGSTTQFYVPNGTAAVPTLSFIGDTNSGLYSVGADQVGVATAGARSFNFAATAGTLEGTTSSTVLSLATNATLAAGTTSALVSSSGRITLDAPVTGTRFAPQQPIVFSAAGAPSMQSDVYTGFAYWSPTVTAGSTPPFDLGGNPHPVLQRRRYIIDVGTESAAAPTWNPGPRTGGTTATLTVSETSAGATTYGTSPFVFDFRTSTTSTVAGNIASVTGASSGVKLSRGPRWCQRVMPGSVITAFRGWYGLASALPTASDTMTGEGVLFRYSTVAADAKWQFCTRDGVTQSCTDTGVAVAASTAAILCADCREGTACTAWVNGVARTRKTTNLPSAATNLNPLWTVETTAGGTARTVGVSSASIEFN